MIDAKLLSMTTKARPTWFPQEVSLTDLQKGITCVAVPKLCPKSMPTIPPFSRSTMKLDRWRSPMPSTYWQLETEAIVRMKWERRVRKASGEAASCMNARLWVKDQEGKSGHKLSGYLSVYHILLRYEAYKLHVQSDCTFTHHKMSNVWQGNMAYLSGNCGRLWVRFMTVIKLS